MNVLEEIIRQKQREIQERKSLFPIKLLEQSIYFDTNPVSLNKYLKRPDKSGIIAEIKRKSPSKGAINSSISIEKTSIGYMQAGASALSILTDSHFFGGSSEDLQIARKFNFCPILRKDFIIDEYQIVESKSIGADVVLIIAAINSPGKIRQLAECAHGLGLEVLLEIHNEKEIDDDLLASADVVGVNSRDLKSLHEDINTAKELASRLPNEITKVAESGISDPTEVMELGHNYGYQGFLIGGHFMGHSRPEDACQQFISHLYQLEAEAITDLKV